MTEKIETFRFVRYNEDQHHLVGTERDAWHYWAYNHDAYAYAYAYMIDSGRCGVWVPH